MVLGIKMLLYRVNAVTISEFRAILMVLTDRYNIIASIKRHQFQGRLKPVSLQTQLQGRMDPCYRMLVHCS